MARAYYAALDLAALLSAFWLIARFRLPFEWPAFRRALWLVSAPFIVWDVLAAGRHWAFDESYVLPLPQWINIPLEEILFYVCFPLLGVTVWLCLDRRVRGRVRPPAILRTAGLLTVAASLLALGIYGGQVHARNALVAVCFMLAVLWELPGLVRRRAFWLYQAAVFVMMSAALLMVHRPPVISFLPVVLSGLRFGPVPLEAMLTAVVLMNLTLVAYLRGATATRPSILKK